MTYRGRVENGTVVLDKPAALPEGATAAVEVAGLAEEPRGLSSLLKHAGRIDLPPDASVNVDHDLYGHPKRE